MDINVIKIGKEKEELYNTLLNKYENFEFSTPEDEKEYLDVLKNLIEDKEIEFEAKAWLLNYLVASIFR